MFFSFANILYTESVYFSILSFCVLYAFFWVRLMYLRLRDVREDCDKTQLQMAKFLGCTQQTYSRYERGDAQMSYETLCRLADYFHTSLDYLMGRTDERTPYPPSKS